jgi:hypothetical protein
MSRPRAMAQVRWDQSERSAMQETVADFLEESHAAGKSCRPD